MRLTRAVINLNNLKRNYLNIRKKTFGTKIMAVVKADAYGHNVKFVTDLLNSLGPQKPEYYAVAIPDEGVELRKLGIKQPILVFDPVDKEQSNKYFKFDLIASVFTKEDINILQNERKRLKFKKKIKVHVKIDTGMNRLGIDYQKAASFINQLNLNNNFIIDGIFTHFATSDVKGSSFAQLQIKRFDSVIESLKKLKINYGLAHAANSGAILDFPNAYYDMVRPGISLYGYYPSHQTSESIKLYPVMSLISKVSTVKKIEKGETVSYSRRFKAKKPTKIISVPLGYADGFPRAFTNKAKGILKGKIYNQIGTVTMDRIIFDIGKSKISIGDEIILLGNYGNIKNDAWDWSDTLNTIPYEVTCGISKRVPRIVK
jgi:alanine racemase